MKTTLDMDVAILVGGKGKRLRSVLRDKPKPLADVEGRAFLEWILLYLRSLGFSRCVLCSGYKGDQIQSYFSEGDRLGIEIIHSLEPSPLGTAGALRYALPKLETEQILVLNGDSFCPFDPDEMAAALSEQAVGAVMWLVEVDDCSRFGTVRITNGGLVEDFFEKREAPVGKGFINAGIYLLERSLIESLPDKEKLSLERDVFPKLTGGVLMGLPGQGPFLDIGTPESFQQAAVFIRQNLAFLNITGENCT